MKVTRRSTDGNLYGKRRWGLSDKETTGGAVQNPANDTQCDWKVRKDFEGQQG